MKVNKKGLRIAQQALSINPSATGCNPNAELSSGKLSTPAEFPKVYHKSSVQQEMHQSRLDVFLALKLAEKINRSTHYGAVTRGLEKPCNQDWLFEKTRHPTVR